MHTALYRAQRPEVFPEILGQEHIVKILKYQIATDTVSHAYLFCGTRGTGKTTTARILAKAVNCLSEGERPCGQCANCQAIKEGTFMDVIEIDAASNNGVDSVRELRESVKYPPAVGRKKVYIIDEVHMLSTGAFNALLKTLEEPPENVIFILATTEPQKLPATILSRCMRLDFRRIPQSVLAEGMKKICQEKGIEITDSAVKLLAGSADGSVRDGLSILDQVISAGDHYIDRDKVLEYIGTAGEDFFIELTEMTAVHNVAGAILLLDEALADGKDVKQLMRDWTAHYRNLLLTKFIRSPEDMLNLSTENVERIRQQSQQISLEEINKAILRLSRTLNDARWSTQPRILMELAIVAIATDLIDETRPAGTPASSPAGGRGIQSQPSRMTEKSQILRNIPGAQEEQTAAASAAEKEEMVLPAADGEAEKDSFALTRNEDSKPPEAVEGAAMSAESSSAKTLGAAPPASLLSRSQLDRLWHQIFEEGEGSASSFNLIRSATSLERVEEEQFVVAVKNDFTRRYAEQKRTDLERLMERHLGRKLKLVCQTVQEETGVSADDDMKEMAKMASETLGIPVEIE